MRTTRAAVVMTERQLLYGLVVESAVPLHGAAPLRADGHPDIIVEHTGSRLVPNDIASGTVLQAVTWGDEMQYSTVELADGAVLLRLHGLVDFVIDPDMVTVRAWTDPRCEREMFGILVAGNLLATVLTLRGETVLHASAVEVDGRAVAFVAHSGMGKSTLAALACARGCRFVTDDLLRVSLEDGEPVRCWPGVPENRLRRPAGELVDGPEVTFRTSIDGRIVWSPPRTLVERPPLAAIVLPTPVVAASPLEATVLSRGAALVELTSRPRLLGWTDSTGRAGQFANLARLVRSVPVVAARIPWDRPIDPVVIDDLLVAMQATISRPDRPTPAA